MNTVRTRFAPSPTGLMHMGNIRTALLNYLFSKKHDGTFILRIEDTDAKRNFDTNAKFIQEHLAWLGLDFQEGPTVGGPYGPYFQSQRDEIYKKYLQTLRDNNFVYRCFCTPEELDTKRQRQIAMKRPPRYDGTCLKLSSKEIHEKQEQNVPFVWRMKIDHNKQIAFHDLARGTLTFDLTNFSDFPLTRENESFTFMFANCVDDMEMKISHVLRGEDHLTNTVGQVVLMQAFNKKLPVFWHLPILCNSTGKKLSKRDRGFSLEDLRKDGFLPEAICNYLGIIGGSFQQEILSLDELAAAYNFDNINSASQIRYDLEKLRWVNHKWISTYDSAVLAQLCKPFLQETYDLSKCSDTTLTKLITSIQSDMYTLHDATELLSFYFKEPQVTTQELYKIIPESKTTALFELFAQAPQTWNEFSSYIKSEAKKQGISSPELFGSLRYLLTGSKSGLQIQDLFQDLGTEAFFKRIQKLK